MAKYHATGSDGAKSSDDAEAKGLVPLAQVYHAIAVRHYEESAATNVPADHGGHTAIAIFFSFAALEAYLPELAGLVDKLPEYKEVDRELVRRARKARNDDTIEDAYGSPDPKAAEGEEWYTACRCLRDLRNALVHYKAKFRPLNEWPDKLQTDNCLQVIQGIAAGSHDWTSQALVAPVAKWACTTVRITIERFHEHVGGPSPWSNDMPAHRRWQNFPAVGGPGLRQPVRHSPK